MCCAYQVNIDENAVFPCVKENKVYINYLIEVNDCHILALKDDDEIDSILYQLYFSMQAMHIFLLTFLNRNTLNVYKPC